MFDGTVTQTGLFIGTAVFSQSLRPGAEVTATTSVLVDPSPVVWTVGSPFVPGLTPATQGYPVQVRIRAASHDCRDCCDCSETHLCSETVKPTTGR